MEWHAKPGVLVLQAIAALTPLVRKLGPRANPANFNISGAAVAAWAFYIGKARNLHIIVWEAKSTLVSHKISHKVECV